MKRKYPAAKRATTNNRMEMMAVIRALAALKKPSTVIVHTDSRYVMDGATQVDEALESQWLENRRQEAGEERTICGARSTTRSNAT